MKISKACFGKAEITERQSEILDAIIREYIDSAQPVSSQVLQKKHDFGICPASIRIEMQKLADSGFISQPHTSAGRVPTDKGYRLFVDKLLKEENQHKKEEDWPQKEVDDTLKLFQTLTKRIAQESHALVLFYLKDEDIFWKEGWEQVLREPEFREQEYILDFAGLLENIEKKIWDINIDSGMEIYSKRNKEHGRQPMEIYIGKENPFSKTREFSVIVSKYALNNGEEGMISILGPKRMAYDRNIDIVNSLKQLFE